MSLPLAPEPATRPTGLDAAKAHLAVVAAFWVGFLPPSAIAALLKKVMRGARESTPQQAAVVRAYICAVSARCAGQGCLQRSIAVVLMCRLAGHVPAWKTGYQVDPFLAHAWVEAGSSPVQEPSSVATYAVVLEVTPQVAARAHHSRKRTRES